MDKSGQPMHKNRSVKLGERKLPTVT